MTKFKYPNALRRIIYSLIMILPAFLTSNIYKGLDTKLTTNMKLSNLTALGSSIYLNLENSESNLQYALSQLTHTTEFKTMDALGIANQATHFLYYNKNVSNLYVLDKNKNTVFGINDNLLTQTYYSNHIDSALRGVPSYYSTFNHNIPFLQFAYPIYSELDTSVPSGVIVATLTLEDINTLFQTINTMDPSIDVLLVNVAGDILAQSQSSPLTSSPDHIDITKIKSGLDFDPNTPFTNLKGDEVNGIYFTITSSNWTLLLTSPKYTGIENIDFISWILGGLGASGVTTSEVIRKRRSATTASVDSENAISSTELVDEDCASS